MKWWTVVLAAALTVSTGAHAAAQDTGAGTAAAKATTTPASTQEESDPDLDPDPSQPDFTLVNLPTTLRLPRHKSAFRVTHRFARPLGAGDFGSLLEDFFGLDSGAQIGLEYRFGLFSGTQVGIHRTSDRTIEFFGQYDLLRSTEARDYGLALVGSVEGTNNFRDSYTPGVGLAMSYHLGRHGAVYATPMWLNNTNPLPGELADDNDTFNVGIGARIRIRPTVYVVGEYVPRAAGFKPRDHQASFAIEKRVGGHSFQLNFNNGFGTTWGQISRGGTSNNDWYLGFNISRKFY